MYSLLIDQWIRAKSSYWFVPTLMSIGAVLLAITLVSIDSSLEPGWIRKFDWLYDNQPEGARALLATVAGSMITVAGVTFSMTLLMVSHASSQIGPRLMSGFMRDRGSQMVLGTFIATFLYCLMVLRTIYSGSGAGDPGATAPFVPHLAVIVAVGLAALSVAVLIYFIHHVPMLINIPAVTGRLGNEIVQQLKATFPQASQDCAREGDDKPNSERPDNSGDRTTSLIRLDGSGGYLRIIDRAGLMSAACSLDRTLETLVVAGDFCVRGTPIIRIHGGSADKDCEKELQQYFSWGNERTRDQDILFLVDQLVEMAGKALSPGVNDQFTAFGCIDQMELVIREAAGRSAPDPEQRDDDGTLRLTLKQVTRIDIAEHFLLPIRQFALGDFITTRHLASMLGRALVAWPPGSVLHDTLRGHFNAVRDEAAANLGTDSQRASIAASCAQLETAFMKPLPENSRI